MVQIPTQRFLLRELREADVNHLYLSWFEDADAQRNISAAADMYTLTALRRYVREREGRADVLFLGIFTRENGTHIGNVKYEPVDNERGVAVMGILIGDPAFRGKGVAQEVLTATGVWLRAARGISRVLLGVEPGNAAAIAAYERVGFRRASADPVLLETPERLVMAWEL